MSRLDCLWERFVETATPAILVLSMVVGVVSLAGIVLAVAAAVIVTIFRSVF